MVSHQDTVPVLGETITGEPGDEMKETTDGQTDNYFPFYWE